MQAAQALRGRLGIAADSPFELDLLETSERELGIGVCILELPEALAGAYLRTGRSDHIFIQAINFPTRQRFTIAHELGHHELGHEGVIEQEVDVGGKTTVPEEQQANYFASELLMPIEAVRVWMDEQLGGRPPELADVVLMADAFHSSPPAMLYRISTGEYPGVDRELLDVLWDAVRESQEHIAIAERLGIGHGDDAVSRCYQAGVWPRLPAGVDPALCDRLARGVRDLDVQSAGGRDDAVSAQPDPSERPL